MKKIQAAQRNTDRRVMFVHDNLHVCTHVFIRTDAVRPPLTPTYEGPYRVLKRLTDKVYTIDVKGVHKNISIDRLKPAFLHSTEETVSRDSERPAYVTRFGRTLRPTVRFAAS